MFVSQTFFATCKLLNLIIFSKNINNKVKKSTLLSFQSQIIKFKTGGSCINRCIISVFVHFVDEVQARPAKSDKLIIAIDIAYFEI
jgi:hypothetical protein